MDFVLAYYWSRKDGERALEWAGTSPENVSLRKGQNWKGEIERCDKVVIFGPLYKVEQAYRNAGIPVEAEDILPDWTPPWLEEQAADNGVGQTPVEKTSTQGPTEAPAVELAFASAPAQKAANEAGLTPEDFAGVEPSGKTGYTKPDVDAVIARKVG